MKRELVYSFLFDVFFGWYAAITLHTMVWYHVILDEVSDSMTSTMMITYIILGILWSAVGSLTNASLGRKIMGLVSKGSWQNTIATHTAWILITLTFITGWIVTKISPLDMFSGERLSAAGRIFSDLLNPNFSIFRPALTAIIETMYLAFMATAFALPFSFILGFLSARNLMKANKITFAIYNALRIFTNFTRSIEPLVWAVIFTVWVKVGPFPGMLALMIHTISSLAKQYSEQIEDIDDGPIEALEATGARPLQVIWYAVVPQIVIPFLSFTIYRWDINVRMATVIGLVGGGGIGTMLNQYQMLAQWREVGLIVLLIALVVWIMDYTSAKVREALQ